MPDIDFRIGYPNGLSIRNMLEIDELDGFVTKTRLQTIQLFA